MSQISLNTKWISTLGFTVREKVRLLWNAAYPAAIALKDAEALDAYLAPLTNQNHLLASNTEGQLIAWYFQFTRDAETWFAFIIHPEYQGKGIGRELISMAKDRAESLNGWVVVTDTLKRADGKPYRSPLQFYLKQGFTQTGKQFKTEVMETTHIQWNHDT